MLTCHPELISVPNVEIRQVIEVTTDTEGSIVYLPSCEILYGGKLVAVLRKEPDSFILIVYDPQSLNRYAFERNNPYNRVDPDGHIAPLVAAALIGVVAGAVVGGLSYAISHQISGEAMTTGGFFGAVGGGAIVGGTAAITGAASLAVGSIIALNAAAGAIGQMVENYGESTEAINDIMNRLAKG